jgi:hypothetical protein
MPKFRVTIEENVVYGIDVDAGTEEAAKEIALNVLVQAEDINQYFMEVTEREVSFVMKKGE